MADPPFEAADQFKVTSVLPGVAASSETAPGALEEISVTSCADDAVPCPESFTARRLME